MEKSADLRRKVLKWYSCGAINNVMIFQSFLLEYLFFQVFSGQRVKSNLEKLLFTGQEYAFTTHCVRT
ncbi:hypothetical protein D5281_19370 [bacterium 1xD42-62]|uniref:Uncharacterized protein n=1 Tax=Parablautia muri TaxID=2320879 RepID=A0A9X5GUB3_9FIRM|nr:hypothetical protein [Parablautia muri]